jgi:hypothetical protein
MLRNCSSGMLQFFSYRHLKFAEGSIRGMLSHSCGFSSQNIQFDERHKFDNRIVHLPSVVSRMNLSLLDYIGLFMKTYCPCKR